MRSNSVDALLSGVTRERLELFQTLSKKRPDSLEQLANYLQRDYEEVKKDAEILANLKEKPVVLYDRIVLETQDQEKYTFMIENKEEINLLLIANQSGVKEEIEKENIRRMLDREEFTERNLSQNSILNSAIVEERTRMIMIKVPLNDEAARETIRKFKGIDITETIFQDKKAAEENQGYEF
ncbi:9665_t:CDS:2 [Gigaspora margarita]|uniref:9665_t:CDS:1 n=1 Tax=Gigaspora margarita TaxID=4874 RepID=A0ABN7W475_GIGMA|nr:9665_t:CDS:2 [Gigaspora margarita]